MLAQHMAEMLVNDLPFFPGYKVNMLLQERIMLDYGVTELSHSQEFSLSSFLNDCGLTSSIHALFSESLAVVFALHVKTSCPSPSYKILFLLYYLQLFSLAGLLRIAVNTPLSDFI